MKVKSVFVGIALSAVLLLVLSFSTVTKIFATNPIVSKQNSCLLQRSLDNLKRSLPLR
jgi:hypothetical protein